MIECDDPVVDADSKVGDGKIIVDGTRQALEVMAKIVAEKPRRPALKRRQFRDGLDGKASQLIGEPAERIGVAYRLGIDGVLSVLGSQQVDRIGGEVRITAEFGELR